MANSMEHWNGDQCIVIDVETTGLDPKRHEIIEIAAIALDSNFVPRRDVLPFDIYMKPNFPERIDKKAMQVNNICLMDVMKTGFDSFTAIDLFEKWVDKIGLTFLMAGERKKIRPLGHNYAFDKSFIEPWLGPETYKHIFSHLYKDTMIAAQFANDKAAMHAEPVPYSKNSLTWLCRAHRIERIRSHRALSDAKATAELYRLMAKQGLFG